MSYVQISVTGGAYRGANFEGQLNDAPVTILVPEGIVSARTQTEADRVRESVRSLLATHDRVEMSAANWSIAIEKVAPPAGETT